MSGEGVGERLDLELEYAEARVRVGAQAYEVRSDGPNGQTERVAVDEQVVELRLLQRRAELVIGLEDRAEDGADVLRVEAEYLVAYAHVEHLARPIEQKRRLDGAHRHLAEQRAQRAWSQHSSLLLLLLLLL